MGRIEQGIFQDIDFSVDPAVIKQAESLLGAEPDLERSAKWIQSPEKRKREMWFSLFLLAATYPALAGACLGVLASDGRPVFYRVGGGFLGRDDGAVGSTEYFKVRTLKRDTDEQEADPLCTTAFQGGRSGQTPYRDSRIHSKFGELLRRSSVDELPQLWSAIRGKIALVGPRGYTPREIEGLKIVFKSGILPAELRDYPEIMARVLPRPGIFGLYSATCRKDLTIAERLLLDQMYCQCATPAGDMRMVFPSIGRIFRMVGAR